MELDEIVAALVGREVHAYPALVSTEADALAWARAGAPSGAVVVAGHQVSPRGRGGFPWRPDPERDLAFSLVLRVGLPAEREGWLYALAVSGLADAVGGAIRWPDEAWREDARAGAVSVQSGPGLEWAVVSVLAVDPPGPRASVVPRIVEAVEARCREPSARVLADYLRRCETLGREVHVRLVPLGPAGRTVRGRAVGVRTDGGLVLDAEDGRRVVVPPQALGVLEQA